jgi:uncharacterized protein (TIGR02145 family)
MNKTKFLIKVSILLLLFITFNNSNAQNTIGSQIRFGINEDVKYWNGSDWIAIASGLPGQTLSFSNSIPSWINNPNGITTNAVSNIIGTTATCGGNVVASSGSPITAKGVCWSTSHNPTITNSHTTDGIGKGSFTSNITGLLSNSTYYIRAYATNSAGTAYGNEVSLTTEIIVTDIDGNTYQTVIIGTQTWLKQNLNTTHYSNGDAIPNIINNSAYSGLTYGAYSNYENDTNYAKVYGRLYNWYAVTDSRNVCPTGWHAPSDAEWTTLTNYLGGEGTCGSKLKEAGTAHWYYPNAFATNESGFSALPGGYRYSIGLYYYIFSNGGWWTTTQNSATVAWYRYMYYNYSSVDRTFNSKANGYAVRCIKN